VCAASGLEPGDIVKIKIGNIKVDGNLHDQFDDDAISPPKHNNSSASANPPTQIGGGCGIQKPHRPIRQGRETRRPTRLDPRAPQMSMYQGLVTRVDNFNGIVDSK